MIIGHPQLQPQQQQQKQLQQTHQAFSTPQVNLSNQSQFIHANRGFCDSYNIGSPNNSLDYSNASSPKISYVDNFNLY